MECSSASRALQIQATSRATVDGVSSTDDSPLVVVMLLHGGSESGASSSSRALLESLESIGPVIFPPRNTKNSSAMRIRCIPSSPPVCVVSTRITDAVAAAASVRPDIVILLPCCSSSSSSIEPRTQSSQSAAITQLHLALPTVPVLHPSNASIESAALCSMLAGDAVIDWSQFAAAAISAARSIWYSIPHLLFICKTVSLTSQHKASSTSPPFPSSVCGYRSGCCSCCCRCVHVVALATSTHQVHPVLSSCIESSVRILKPASSCSSVPSAASTVVASARLGVAGRW
jgi:hypothetical protein